MWLFWILSLLPISICGIFVFLNKRISYQEWIITTVTSLLMAGIFQIVASHGMTDDVETWSGYVTSARQFSRWKEYYEYAVYRTEYYWTTETYYTTDSKGRSQSHTRRVQKSRRVFDHWEPTSTWHSAYWRVYTTLGDYSISEDKYKYICKKFNDEHAVAGRRTTGEHNSRMIDGDPNDYVTDNKTGWIEPVTDTKHFENRVKAAPSLFSFTKVPTNVVVYSWPYTTDLFVSSRVMGLARSEITTLKWDQMNARLGAGKKVNVIIVGYPNDVSMDRAMYQEAKWIGGKKNDLVIVYSAEKGKKPNWVKVFGWTERFIVKENLQSMLLDTVINDDVIPNIEKEITTNYRIKDWSKFDYITIEPPTWSYWVYFGVMILVQGGLMVWYSFNEIDQESDGSLYWTWPKSIAEFIKRCGDFISDMWYKIRRK